MKELKKQFSKLWWTSIFTTLIFLIVGIMLILKPTQIITMISMIVGIGIIIVGIFAFTKYFKTKNHKNTFRFEFIYGVICAVAGILLVFNPEAVASILPLVLGIWMVINSMTKIEYVMMLKQENDKRFIATLILTVITLAAGILFVFNPFKGAAILMQILGFVIAGYALIDLINAFLLRQNVKGKAKDLQKLGEKVQDAVLEED